jgi:hypothetical protein
MRVGATVTHAIFLRYFWCLSQARQKGEDLGTDFCLFEPVFRDKYA